MNGLDIARAGDGIAVLTFDRPSALNALDTATRFAVVAALGGFARDSNVAAVIFTGSGNQIADRTRFEHQVLEGVVVGAS